jgi:hypothetical protein
MSAQEEQDTDFFRQQYHIFLQDLAVIKKYYFTKSECSDDEKQAAQKAVLKLGAGAAGMIFVATGGIIGAVSIIKGCQKTKTEPIKSPPPVKKTPSVDDAIPDLSPLTVQMQTVIPQAISARIEGECLEIKVPQVWYDSLTRSQKKEMLTNIQMFIKEITKSIKFVPIKTK